MKKSILFVLSFLLISISCHKDALQGPPIPPPPPGPDFRLKFIGEYNFISYSSSHPNPVDYNYDTLIYQSKIVVNPATNNTIFIYNSDTTNYFETKIDTNGVMETKDTYVGATSTHFEGYFIGTDSLYYYRGYHDGHYGLYSNTNVYGKKISE